MKRTLGVVCAGGFLLIAGVAGLSAQAAPSYGVASESSFVLSVWQMETREPGIAWAINFTNTYRYLTSASVFLGSARLPQGALLTSIELEACDTAPAGQVSATLFRATSGAPAVLSSVFTGSAAVPGCSRFTADVLPGEVVDNDANVYLIGVDNTPFDGTATIAAVRVFYRLQVSPAPGTATFNDVPTSDPAFQFIEALVASGVTAGCGSGNFCPDAPLTRRQMAVFLSKVLGLHWPEGPAI